MTIARTLFALAALCLAAAEAGAARAAASGWARTDMGDARLVSAAAAVGEARSVPLGLQFALAEGWKIYWRTPGEAGYPPSLDIVSSENLAGLEWSWPVPRRFETFGLQSYGYADGIVFPIAAALIEPGRPLAIEATVRALACKEICVPLEAPLSLALPAGPAGPTAYTQLVGRFRALAPRPGVDAGLSVAAVRAAGGPDAPALAVEIASDRPLVAPDVFVEAGPGHAFGKPEVAPGPGGRTATVTLPAALPPGGALDGLAVTVTAVDGARFVEAGATVGAAADGPGGAAGTRLEVWAAMLGLALLGGLVLNLMPCVLPVLSLKLLGALRHAGAARGAIRRGFLASAAGILASFLVLAAGAIALKQAGMAAGWGIQFQQPLFLAAMIVVLGGFAANLFGRLEIPLPAALGRLGAAGPNAAGDDGLAGHFLAGAFATLLATPCSAPFVGTAIGFALSAGTVEILAIFTAMGVGLAAPFLLVAAWPGTVRALPRPGRWMETLRRVLGLALLGTALWLATVLAAQLEREWFLTSAGALAAAGLLLAVRRGRAARPFALGAAALCAAAIAAAGAGGPVAAGPGGAPEPDGSRPGAAWRAFDPGAIPGLVAQGRVVFVDVTADWCLTCQVNKAAVLEAGETAARLARGDVVAMRADWTRPDGTIAAYLASFGRYGIPFDAVYGPGAPVGIALPELLTQGAALAALERAGAGPAR